MINDEKYIPNVEKKAIPELHNLAERLSLKRGNFHKNSASCHTSKLVKAFLKIKL